MKRKFDMRYADERRLSKYAEKGPPPLYRADLLEICRNGAARHRGNLERYPFLNNQASSRFGVEFRRLAELTGLSTGTIQSTLKGEAAKLDSVKTLANYFGIPWLKMFDLDDELDFDKNGRFVGKRKARAKK